MRARKALQVWIAAFLALAPRPATAQPLPEDATQSDRPAEAQPVETEPAAPPPLPRYHHSVFSWENSVTTETLGIGDSPQTSNPTYEMGFATQSRYYFLDRPGETLSVRAELGLYREFTNSDSSTQRGEWSLSDTDLALAYLRRFAGPADTNGTLYEVRPVTLSLPTSKASFASGRYFALGALLGLVQVTPLLEGRFKPDLLSTIRLAVGYSHWFARATVPTNNELDRVRLTPGGRSSPGDQLSGSSLVRHQLSLLARFRLAFGDAVLWTTDAALQPAWKYSIPERVEICGVVATGCATVVAAPTDTRYVVRTQLNTEVSVRLTRGFSLDLGYENVAQQMGTDGRRRSFFYSPDARFYAALSFVPHELESPPKRTASAPVGLPRF